MLFHDPSCRAETTLRENNALGMYELCRLDWVSICTKSDSGSVYIDAQIDAGGKDLSVTQRFLDAYSGRFQFNGEIETYPFEGSYFYKICIRRDENYFVFSLYYKQDGPVNPDNLQWLYINTQFKYAYTLLNNEAIQERELSENIIDSIGATILVMDLRGHLVSIHGDLESTFGADFSGLTDPALLESASSYSWRQLTTAFQEVLGTGDKRQLDNLVFHKGDVEHIINATLSPLRDSKDQIAGAVLVGSDVTELRYMEHELQQTKQFGLLGQISAGLAHDVKNPLMNITGCARALIKNAQLPPEHMELLNIIVHEGGRINEVIEQMLSFGKVTAPREPAELNINGLLANCGDIIHRQKSVKRIDVVQDLDPRIPPITGDSNSLQQAFLNILVNALEAISETGTVRVVSRLLDGGAIRVTIQDDGCGVPEQDLRKLFAPYYSTKSQSGSSGLGLFLAKRVFDQHGASITMESRARQGTRVIITFPAPSVTGGPTPI